MNTNLININFHFTSGEKFSIQCSPYIKVKEMITYFFESLIGNTNQFTINELSNNLFFLYNATKIDINSLMHLDKIGIKNDCIIVVWNQKNLSFDKKSNLQKESKNDVIPESIIMTYSEEEKNNGEDFNLFQEYELYEDLEKDDPNGWNLIFENEDDKKQINIKISEQKLVIDAIKEYYQKSRRSDKCIFIFDNKKLNYALKICQSGLRAQSRILVIPDKIAKDKESKGQ